MSARTTCILKWVPLLQKVENITFNADYGTRKLCRVNFCPLNPTGLASKQHYSVACTRWVLP